MDYFAESNLHKLDKLHSALYLSMLFCLGASKVLGSTLYSNTELNPTKNQLESL